MSTRAHFDFRRGRSSRRLALALAFVAVCIATLAPLVTAVAGRPATIPSLTALCAVDGAARSAAPDDTPARPVTHPDACPLCPAPAGAVPLSAAGIAVAMPYTRGMRHAPKPPAAPAADPAWLAAQSRGPPPA